ncbi:Ig-like domain-containing protein [Daejeonella sp.]|uniref:Ig-like domain-containing protein n=1 Tax=Daejeonella sp. TaxID=2805397 RepID=UPI0039834D94
MRIIVTFIISSIFGLLSASAQFEGIKFTAELKNAISHSEANDFLRLTDTEEAVAHEIIRANNSPPVAVNDAARTETNTAITFSIVENDSDPDGNATLDLTSIDIDPGAGTQSTFTVAGQGTYVANNNGTITFTPVTSFQTGQFTATPISYTIKDNTGLSSNSATITMMVNPKTAPVANPDQASTLEDTNVTFNLIVNDTDLNGNNTIDIASVDMDPAAAGRQISFTVTGQGTYTVNNSGVLTLVPVPNYNSGSGTATSIFYTVADRDGFRSSPAPITVTVTAVPDSPVAVADVAVTNEDNSITFSLIANDTDADGNNTINPSSIDFDPGTGVLTVLSVINEGTYSALSNGTITYTPVANYNSGTSNATPITYTIRDNSGLVSNSAQITISVIPVNDPPSVSNISKSGNQGQIIVFMAIDFKTKFTDPENSALSKIRVVNLPLNGSLKLLGSAVTAGQEIDAASLDALTFSPLPGWNGITNFGWNGNDGTIYSTANALVVITVAPVNQPPIVSEVIKNHTDTQPLIFVALDFTNKFADPESSVLAKIQIVSLPTGGTLRLSGTNITAGQEIPLGSITGITYLPDPGQAGVFSFKWNGSDGTQYALVSSTVTINIVISNRPPLVNDITKSSTGVTPVSFAISDFTSRFSDPENNSLIKIKVLTLPANGILSFNGVSVIAAQEINLADLAKLSFKPIANWGGMTTFAWNGHDGNQYAVNSANVIISILLPTDPNAKIGAAKMLHLVSYGTNGSYDVKFLFTLVNYGSNGLEKISLQDDLSQAFSGTTFSIKNLTAHGNLRANPLYNGSSNTELLLPSSILTGGEQSQVEMDISVRLVTRAGLFYNYAFAEGSSVITAAKVQDRSTDGLKPDPVVVGDVSLSEITPIELASRPTFIPEGFTPNNDGINDVLAIENTLGQKISIEVFNRWGNRVYRAVDYKNDWAGRCTEGIYTGQDIPDGTYFYVVMVENKDKFAGSLTVQR